MVVRRGGRLIPHDRHPLVLFLLAWAASIGVGGAAAALVGGPRPSAAGQLPWWLDGSWYALLGVGATLVIVGMWWRDPIAGVLIARAGYWPLGAGSVVYAAALWLSGQHRSAVIIGGFAVACVWRASVIRRDVRAELAGDGPAGGPP